MERRGILILAAGLGLAPGLAPGAGAQTAALRGSATYLERMALPPGAVLEVALLDISRADAAAEAIATVRIPITGSVPVGFVLPYDPARILPRHRYALRATISLEGQTLFRTGGTQAVTLPGPDAPVELRLRRAAGGEAAPGLVGPDWVVAEIEGRPVPPQPAARLHFTAEGRVAGIAGCNRIAGGYRLAGQSITFDGLASTMMACLPPLGEQEERFKHALGAVRRWRPDPAGPLLLDAGNRVLIRLARP
ncbi:YbaY family lipoprotein [Roseicella sp. DB1501]|uniref:YbaY family lipoprotein n=1 Tax=Roseicella sp. DB1501 TaxID=2730925 RepID=UPI001492F736|nr:YbaY family lipoprotein [Roseicella sp. DB1501]NOG71315.1 META domain-containing protein [Roseicella sp. DB1501]